MFSEKDEKRLTQDLGGTRGRHETRRIVELQEH